MPNELGAAFITEIAVLMIWAFAPYYFFITFRESGRPLRLAVILTVVTGLWAMWGFGASKYNVDSFLMGDFPGRPFVYLLIAAAIVWAFRWQLVGDGLSQRLLIALQLCRPLGLVFVIEHYRGNLPGIFAHPAGWGDLLAGLVALAVLVAFRNRPAIPGWAVITVAVVGLLDFTSAFFFGFTSSATPLQLFSFDAPNQVLAYPTGIIPLYLVPIAVIFHILSITELQRANRAATEPAQPAAVREKAMV